VTIHFVGKPAHAAYPETGISPAPAVGQLLVDLPALAAPEQYRGITLFTVIGGNMGEKGLSRRRRSCARVACASRERDDDLARRPPPRVLTAARRDEPTERTNTRTFRFRYVNVTERLPVTVP